MAERYLISWIRDVDAVGEVKLTYVLKALVSEIIEVRNCRIQGADVRSDGPTNAHASIAGVAGHARQSGRSPGGTRLKGLPHFPFVLSAPSVEIEAEGAIALRIPNLDRQEPNFVAA